MNKPDTTDTWLDEAFGKYLTNDGTDYTIRIGKQIVRVKDDDFKVLKTQITNRIQQERKEARLDELRHIDVDDDATWCKGGVPIQNRIATLEGSES